MGRHFSCLFLGAAIFAVFVEAATVIYKDPADGKDYPDIPTRVMLHAPGISETVSVFYKGAAVADVSITAPNGNELSLFRHEEPIMSVAGGYTNVTCTLSGKNNVGKEGYIIKITDKAGGSAEITGTLIIAGIVVMDDTGKVVSGDDGSGVTVEASRSYTYKAKAIDTSGNPMDATGTKISFQEKTGTYMKVVEKAAFGADSLTIAMANGRYGSGSFQLTIENPAITYGGESFETVLLCTQPIPATVPCYARGGTYEIGKDGFVKIPMYNLMVPPQKRAISKIGMAVGTSDIVYYEKSASTMTLPNQMVVFSPTATGKASITCDGAAAVTHGGDIIISGVIPEAPGEGTELATSFTRSLDHQTGYDIISAKATFVNSSPKLLTWAKAQMLLKVMCDEMVGQKCTLEKVVAGSAKCSVSGLCPVGESKSCISKLTNCFGSGACQKRVGETKETLRWEDMQVTRNEVLGATGGVAAGGAALATWTIILIAVVGAFAIILLIMLALWAVYRRNAEQSESDYSSSGPLGVPDPSDLLYEQSIVRDIYGRGDFPEGGPTAAAAAERAREADMREEFPRPPSSSGVSRGAQTDDASSTYSV